MSLLKVLHVIPNLRKGGAERIALNICHELSQREDIVCKLVVFQPDNAYTFLTDTLDVTVIPSRYIPSLSGKPTKDVQALQTFVDAFDPDVIHSHLFEAEMALSQIESTAKRVVHFHDNMPQLAKIPVGKLTSKASVARSYERKIVLKNWKKRPTTAIAVSEDAYTFIEQNLPKHVAKQKLLNAIETKRFFCEVQSKEEQRLVMIGSFVPKKSQALAIDTIEQLKKEGTEVHLDLLGDGPLRDELEAQVKQCGVASLVHFRGNVDHPESFLSKAFAYIHTANYEPFGLVLLEAMAAGLPVVCSDGGGNRDLIREGENGWIISERDPKQLADKVKLLLSDESLRQQMGRKAQDFSRKFDISTYVDRLLTVYSN